MPNNKYLILLGLFTFMSLGIYAQSYDWKDETLIPKSGKSQQSEFLQNQYPFPAKPRNQWEIGLSVGNVFVSGDVSTRMPNWAWGAHIRKAMGYVFSARLSYSGGIATGMNWSPSFNYGRNPAWASKYNAPVNMQWAYAPLPGMQPGALYQVSSVNNAVPFEGSKADAVYSNYRTSIHQVALQGIFTLNNVRFHKSKTGFLLYGIAGIGGMVYETNVNALDGNNGTYAGLFNQVNSTYNGGQYKNRNKIRRDLRAGMDKTYETPADGHQFRRPKLFDMTFKPTVQAGFGVSFKLNKRFSLGIEEVLTWTNDDLLDGQRWQETPYGDAAMTRDFDNWHYTSVNVNYSLGAKSVAPLWWLNPLDFSYNELNAPRHMKMPKPVLDDADGDGVTDQFDREPNTPAGTPVDTHGVSRDTDGDGVPDSKDKELITPTQCQPVDADGVGKCPDPECCKNGGGGGGGNSTCSIEDLPSINFGGGSSALSSDSKKLLENVAASLRSNPGCKVVVCGSAAKSKSGQAIGQKRVDVIANYLIQNLGITSDRVLSQYDCSSGDPAVVELRPEQK